MELNSYAKLGGSTLKAWLSFMETSELRVSEDADYTAIAKEDGKIIAAGSRCGRVLKYIAVDPNYQGLGLTGSILTALSRNAFENDIRHLFIYTKPENRLQFEESRFYTVEQTDRVLLMENKKDGIKNFIESLPEAQGGVAGAVVMNCNPFTLGHRYLIEYAAARCDRLYAFILSEEKSLFSAADRLAMVKAGTRDIKKLTVLGTGDYLVSSASFPDYFLGSKSEASYEQCALDCRIFAKHYAPRLGISIRFAGSEPLSAVTESYNRAMEELLPAYGIEFRELPRLKAEGDFISASKVRTLLGQGRKEELRKLLPLSTLNYLEEHGLV